MVAMNGYSALMGLLGAGAAAGLLLVALGLRGTDGGTAPVKARPARREGAGRWLAAAVAAGVLVGAWTRWPVGALLAGFAMWNVPSLLGTGKRDGAGARLEAVAGWTEMLRDTLAAAAGLEQTIIATAPMAPEAIGPEVTALAEHLRGGQGLPEALRQTAVELSDPTADLVIAALVLAVDHPVRELGPLLGELAAVARGQVEVQQRVAASRARTRTTLRVVVGTTVCFGGGLIILNPAFLRPYGTATGQFVLLGIGGLFWTALAWLRRMSRAEQPDRFFTAAAGTSGEAG
jgi:hypothetical protein